MAALSEIPSSLRAGLRKVRQLVGFTKTYNFTLWIVFAGALMGFCIARMLYFNYNGIFCAPDENTSNHAIPGECWTYDTKAYLKVGIKMHIFCIVPAGFLACFQFIPTIRHKAILVHRISGYILLVLSVIGTIGVLMVARVSFGGGLEIQVIAGLMSIMFLTSLGFAYYNIKVLQLEQHRAWMLRAWFYAAAIVTTRLIMVLAAMITSIPAMGPYYKAMPCDKLATFYDNSTALIREYPTCTSGSVWAAVKADMHEKGLEHLTASLSMSFGMALWLGLAIHAIGIEFYLRLTPAEAQRLRKISYQRQLEAGYKRPGSTGLTADRVGNAKQYNPADDDSV